MVLFRTVQKDSSIHGGAPTAGSASQRTRRGSEKPATKHPSEVYTREVKSTILVIGTPNSDIYTVLPADIGSDVEVGEREPSYCSDTPGIHTSEGANILQLRCVLSLHV